MLYKIQVYKIRQYVTSDHELLTKLFVVWGTNICTSYSNPLSCWNISRWESMTKREYSPWMLCLVTWCLWCIYIHSTCIYRVSICICILILICVYILSWQPWTSKMWININTRVRILHCKIDRSKWHKVLYMTWTINLEPVPCLHELLCIPLCSMCTILHIQYGSHDFLIHSMIDFANW